MATGSLFGVKEALPGLKVVWIDAHADINTQETSPSGNFHGMPVAPLVGLMGEKTIPGFDWLKPNFAFEDLVYVGLRHLDKGEKEVIRESGIRAYDMDTITGIGIGQVMTEIFEYFSQDGEEHPIYCSFDIDGIDPQFVMQTGTRSRGGLTDRESHYILRQLVKSGLFVGMDLVEINPLIEDSSQDG